MPHAVPRTFVPKISGVHPYKTAYIAFRVGFISIYAHVGKDGTYCSTEADPNRARAHQPWMFDDREHPAEERGEEGASCEGPTSPQWRLY